MTTITAVPLALRYANRISTLIIVNSISQDRLQRALTDFHLLLTPDELLIFTATGAPSALSVVELTSDIDKKKSMGGLRQLGPFFEPLLQSIQQFSSVIETMISSNSKIAALVWGSVKFVINAALNFFGYFEKLAEMFRRLGLLCPIFKEFQLLFSESAEIRESLTEFFAIVIEFCTEALRFLKEKPLLQFAKSLWKTFQIRFQGFETQLREQREKISLEIQLASERAAHRARQETSLYQHKAQQHRSDQIKRWAESRAWEVGYDAREKEMKRAHLLEKISDYNYMSSFSKARSQRYQDTGLWLFETPEFRLWDQEDKSSGLWCSGIPGSGKTILITGAIDYLFAHRQGTTTSINYFFCEFANEQSRDIRTIFCSLIKQTLNVFDRLPAGLEGELEAAFIKNHHREPEIEELYQLLVSVTQLSATTYLLIDGLDECKDDDRRQLSLYLNRLIRTSTSKVRILISSRPELDISQSLRTFHLVSLKALAIRSDIALFIRGMIDQRLADGSLVVKEKSMVEEIKEALIHGSDGMFLWVTFQIHDICRENNDEDIRQVLRSLPKGLDETYTRILKRIVEDRKPDVAKRIFQWLAVSRRTLTLDELVEAIAFKPGCLKFDEGSFPTDKLRMLHNCGNLVTHDEQDNLIQFAHYTVLEFLLSSPLIPDFLIQRPEANLYAGKVCLTYLSFPDFETQICIVPKDPVHNISALDMPISEWKDVNSPMEWLWKIARYRLVSHNHSEITARRFLMPKDTRVIPPEPSEELSRKFHLAKYAAAEWIFHCSELSQDDEDDWILFEGLVFYRTLPFAHRPWKTSETNDDDLKYTPQFKWAVENDHVPLLNLIIDKVRTASERQKGFQTNDKMAELETVPTYVERGAGTGHTPLQIASMRGSKNALHALIDLGADINAKPTPVGGRTALQAAAGSGHLPIMEILLVLGADINAEPATVGGRTALQAAAGAGQLAVVEKLIVLGADINAKPGARYGKSALQAAATGGHLAIVDRLLSAGANVNTKSISTGGRTALQAAAGSGRLAIVNRLIACGADVNGEPSFFEGRTALQAASGGGHLAVVDQLLSSGAHINEMPASSGGRTALQAAAEGGHLAVVDRLLESNPKADVNSGPASEHGRTALQAAAGCAHLTIIDRLIAAGADVNAGPGVRYGRTALQAAAENDYLTVVNKLLSVGADVNAEPAFSDGRTALQAAAGAGHLTIVNRLLELRPKVDVNADPISRNGRTALQAAAEGGHLAIVNRLLRFKADVNGWQAPSNGMTALQAAAAGGHLDIVDRLLAAGALVNVKPASPAGRTALQAAAEGGHMAVVNRLLEAEAYVNAKPASPGGLTALQAAAGAGHLDVVERLLTANANVNADAAPEGLTALQAAAAGGYLDIVDKLMLSHAHVTRNKGFKSRSQFVHNETKDGRTAIQKAAEGGHLAVVKRLVEVKANIHEKPAFREGLTALEAAAEGGHLAVVELLLKYGANVNGSEAWEMRWGLNGKTALRAAAEGGHLDVVLKLMQSGADINAKPVSKHGRTALQAAAENGHLTVVKSLIESGADINAGPGSEYGRTALQAAAARGHLGVVEFLIESRADINAKPGPKHGRTALQAAVENDHLTIVDRLLESGADINAAPGLEHGLTALQAAAGSDNLYLVDRLLAFGANVNARPGAKCGRTALQAAAECGHLAVVNRLIASKAHINSNPSDGQGRTALQAAAGAGHLAVVERLLTAGASVNAGPSFSEGRTALQAAAEGGHFAIAERLLEAGADNYAKPASLLGRTALEAAAEGGYGDIVALLLHAGAPTNVPSYSRTALQSAAEGGYLSIVTLLLEFKANANELPVTTEDGITALRAAAGGGHLEVVNKLLEAGADVNLSPEGVTALQAAAEGGHLPIVERLLEKGAYVNRRPETLHGKTAIQAAAGRRHTAVVERLRKAGAREDALFETDLDAKAERLNNLKAPVDLVEHEYDQAEYEYDQAEYGYDQAEHEYEERRTS